ncbi:MAG TPA: TrbI/VirB10 family protein [Sphingomicrobium sp.]|jgi:type IV secretion system protein VirB10
MTSNRTNFAEANTIRGPWEDPVRGGLPVALPQTDPRAEISENALVLASQNAFPIVATQKSRRDSLGLAAGAAVALVLGAATFMSLSSGRHASTVPAGTAVAMQAQQQPGVPMGAPIPGRPMVATPMVPGDAQTVPAPGPVPGPMRLPSTVNAPNMPPAASPVLVYDGSSAPMNTVTAGPNSPRDVDGAPTLLAGATGARGGAIGDNASVHATRLSEPANTVAQGTLIPAVLETAIDSDVPGYVRAVVSQDVRSFDGSRVLIPRSSRLIGEYKAASQAGQRRAYLMWTRLIRPDGVSVALASPAVDYSGQAGIGGQVNSHFFSRFGSAILLSILGGASTLATGGAGTIIMSGGQSAASVAAQRDSSRNPTIKVRQGEPIKVFTARDLIFGEDGANG